MPDDKNDQELRVTCLREALFLANTSRDFDDVLGNAEEFYKFVTAKQSV